MKSVLDNLQPELRPKMWQRYDTEGIVHKEFVRLGQTVNGKFYCDVLR
jgi:Transposase.